MKEFGTMTAANMGAYTGKTHGGAYGGACYETHKPLKLGKGELYGGSAQNYREGCDIYISFDSFKCSDKRAYPWNEGDFICFPVHDMSVPKGSDVDEYKKLVTWTCNQLQDGKKVHAGCMMGHGRTGMFLAAVIKEMTGEEDAITYVRKHYCKKVVESKEQVAFLGKHYGIKAVEGSKENTSYSTKNGIVFTGGDTLVVEGPKTYLDRKNVAFELSPMPVVWDIWGIGKQPLTKK